MWKKIKEGVRSVRVIFRIPEDEWEEFRAKGGGMEASEQVRQAIREYRSQVDAVSKPRKKSFTDTW